MKKTFMCTFIAILIVLNTSFAFASAGSVIMSGDVKQSDALPIPASAYTPDHIREQRLSEASAMCRQRSMARVPYLIIVTVFEQEKSYYCGPATVKQVIHFLAGNSKSQDYYADKLGTSLAGTEMPLIASVIRAEIPWTYYYEPIGTMNNYIEKIKFGVLNKKQQPAILDLDTRKVEAFPYDSAGHFVNVSGFEVGSLGDTTIRITDPYKPGLGNRWYNLRDLYQASSNHFRKAILW